jgi:adenosylcobinamide-phosphate synthase
MIYTFQIIAALFLDFLFGDPRWYPHPVKLIGFVCSVSENAARKYIKNPLFAGFITVTIVLFITGGTLFVLLSVCYRLSAVFGDLVAVVLLYTTFAAKDLIRHSGEVFNQLTDNHDLDEARRAVGRIVGRDTEFLDKSEISKACVETVAENMADGITAPFFSPYSSACCPSIWR